ncbi:MAG: hypothetical protein EBZ74_06350 [Planctomycetia bacterium]|nr:hypothetical protein [Planctomycetia bacterium]
MPQPSASNPSWPRRGIAGLLVAAGSCLVAAWSAPAGGQQPGPPGQLKSLTKDEQIGQVVEIGPGVLQLRLPKGGNLWQAVPAPDAKIEVTGRASREMLQPKQFVTCTVSLDELGKVTEPALQVAFTDGGAPGVMAGGLGVAEAGAKRLAGRRPAGSYLVCGTIKRVEGDVVTVLAGREKFDIPVPPEADLVVRSGNVGLAAPGDEVEVEGRYYQQGQLIVTALKITLANQLAPPPPKNKPRRPAP